jgi:hypothetical protein
MTISIYFLWEVKPIQAYDYICQAAPKLLKLLYMYVHIGESTLTKDEIWELAHHKTEKTSNWNEELIGLFTFWKSTPQCLYFLTQTSEFRIVFVVPGSRIDAYESSVEKHYDLHSGFKDEENRYGQHHFFQLDHILLRTALNNAKLGAEGNDLPVGCPRLSLRSLRGEFRSHQRGEGRTRSMAQSSQIFRRQHRCGSISGQISG